MATWRKPAERPAEELAPAAERGEHWWPVALAILVVAGLHVALPARYRIQPGWVVPVVLLALLAAGAMIWATNIIAFGLWYWDLDRGGAAARAHHPDRNPAFVFPEMLHKDYVPTTWVPKFVDYFSLSFWTSTAVSPTDISAIKPWAKLLMMLEAACSIVLVALVIARAINVL